MTGRGENGAVLLAVLVALALLAALAGVAMRQGQSGLMSLNAERAEFSREVLAQSALAALGQQLGANGQFPRDSTPVRLALPGGAVEVRVQAAEGLVNPVHARLPVVQALLTAEGASPDQALRLARAISAARAKQQLRGPEDAALLFVADKALWGRVSPYLTFLGSRTTVDPVTAPALLRDALRAIQAAGVDLTATRPRKGYYEVNLRVLGPGETLDSARGFFTHYALLRDRQGHIHLFSTSWPEERGG